MPNPMITEQWPRFVLPIVRKEWFNSMSAINAAVSALYGIDTSGSSVEYSQGIGSQGLVPEYNSFDAEGRPATIEYGKIDPLFEKTFTHKEFALGMSIERKLWDDDRMGNIRRSASEFGQAWGKTIAYHQASVFNNAFSTSYLGADAVALCSASHPYNSVNATAIANLGTSALTYDSVKATLAAGKALVDDRGHPMPAIYRTLVVPTELEAKAYEIINAINKPGGADNDANFLRSQGLSVIVDPWLTDANNWFMADPVGSKTHLLWYWRVRPEVSMDPTSDYQLKAMYRGYMRMSYGWDDWRWVFGHNVT